MTSSVMKPMLEARDNDVPTARLEMEERRCLAAS